MGALGGVQGAVQGAMTAVDAVTGVVTGGVGTVVHSMAKATPFLEQIVNVYVHDGMGRILCAGTLFALATHYKPHTNSEFTQY